MKDLISVIVPIYNVEKYLKRCIESILNQTYFNIEIILVNDGSTDNSLEIANEYKKNDSRIKVISKKNGGLSSARNIGIDNANGKYLTFIDSDDYISSDYIEILYNSIIKYNSDISVAIFKLVFEDNSQKRIYKTKRVNEYVNDRYNMLIKMFYQKDFDTSAVAKLFSVKIFEGVRFPEGLLYEDLATIYKLFMNAKKISYINKEIYFYFQRKGSITKDNFKVKDFDLINIVSMILDEMKSVDKKNNLNNKLLNAVVQKYLSANFYILRKIGFNSDKYKKYRDYCIKNIKQYKCLNFNARLKNNLAVILFSINPKIVTKF